MDRAAFINAWADTATEIRGYLDDSLHGSARESFDVVIGKSSTLNPWFTREQVGTALDGITRLLDREKLAEWLAHYPVRNQSPVNVGVIMAGNIPMAGFHDLLCVLASGNRISVKPSSSDNLLIPFITKRFLDRMPSLKNHFVIVEKLNNVDAIIATGSNNTSRYFEYYFGSKPHLFRKNRNSAAVINGTESEKDLQLLGRDIFTYFGLGCRNVSKVYVPEGYRFDDLFVQLVSFGENLLEHNKYMNNFDYYRAIFLMNQKQFLTNNFLIITEDEQLASPVSVLNYEYYSGSGDVEEKLEKVKEDLQCIIGKNRPITFGQAQFPQVNDYADGVDTMEFLLKL